MPTQSIQYSFDMRSTLLGLARPLDIQYPQTPSGDETTDQTGGFPLYIPGDLDFDPSDPYSGVSWQSWSVINNAKRAAILAAHPGFSYCTYDDMDSASSFDASTAAGVFIGGRGSFMLGDYLSGSTITTNSVALFGSAPDEAYVWIDGGHYVASLDIDLYNEATAYADPKDGRCQRFFAPLNATYYCIVDVSFNGGSTWLTNVAGSLINVPLADQGTNFKMRITRRNASPEKHRILILGWGIIY